MGSCRVEGHALGCRAGRGLVSCSHAHSGTWLHLVSEQPSSWFPLATLKSHYFPLCEVQADCSEVRHCVGPSSLNSRSGRESSNRKHLLQSQRQAVQFKTLCLPRRREAPTSSRGPAAALFWQSWAIKPQVTISEPDACRQLSETYIFSSQGVKWFIKYDGSFVPRSASKRHRRRCWRVTVRMINEQEGGNSRFRTGNGWLFAFWT